MLLHRSESNPRFRSGVIAVEILDMTPAWTRYRDKFDELSRLVPRLRQKVVMPALPTTGPRWVSDSDFDLTYHVRRIRVPEPSSLRAVFDVAELMIQSPIDVNRPLWSATLVEGLPDGQAASLLHFSHALADGVGGVQLFGALYDLERNADSPTREVVTPRVAGLNGPQLTIKGLSELPLVIAGRLREGVHSIGGALQNPLAALEGSIGYVRSSARVLAPAAEPSPLLRARSLRSATDAIDIRLSDLKNAATAAGASVNDAYLAGLCGMLGRYHDELGVPVETLPMAVPVSLRSKDDSIGGNRFAGVTIAAPIGTPDPRKRMRDIATQMARKRDEPAIDIAAVITPWLNILPDALLEPLAGFLVTSDVQASNVPVYVGDTYLAGAKVLRQYGLGPLPGVAMMVVLVSRAGWCTVNVRYDQAAVSNAPLLRDCLVRGFDEVLGIGGPAHCRPASFDLARPDK